MQCSIQLQKNSHTVGMWVACKLSDAKDIMLHPKRTRNAWYASQPAKTDANTVAATHPGRADARHCKTENQHRSTSKMHSCSHPLFALHRHTACITTLRQVLCLHFPASRCAYGPRSPGFLLLAGAVSDSLCKFELV